MSCPLDGIRVLDLSRVLAGPWASQTLADLGAEVIKVERPSTGDDTRSWGPPYATDAGGKSNSDFAYFLSTNRGKKSVAIDFADPQGRNAIRELARTSDILIENFKVGGLAKYGLDYGTLAPINPRLVYCSITGFGQTGPYRDRAGYDFMVQGLGGLMSVWKCDCGAALADLPPVVDMPGFHAANEPCRKHALSNTSMRWGANVRADALSGRSDVTRTGRYGGVHHDRF